MATGRHPKRRDGEGKPDVRKVLYEPARARVRRRDEGEPGGELHRARHPGHHDAAVLQGSPESLDGIAAELVQLVEEQDAVVPKSSSMFLGKWPSRCQQEYA
jgi:hypothetical protein